MAAMTRENPYADLPRVVIVDRLSDSGEFGNANCPHCGAEGRYVYHFRTEDGRRMGAMKGCFSRFPKHPIASKVEYLLGKQADYAKKGWTLPSWDQAILDAADAFADGRIGEDEAMAILKSAESQRLAYQSRKYGGRRR